MADKLFAGDNHGMAGVVSSLKSHNQIGKFCQKIYNFTFAFVSPLGPDYYYVRHLSFLYLLPPASDFALRATTRQVA